MRILLACVAVFAFACAGNDDDVVLHLREYDATEAQYRTFLRLEVVSPLRCAPFRGLTDQDFVDLVDATENRGEGSVWPAYAARVGLKRTGRPHADNDARLRASEIILEECRRFES